ncbi:NACHT domain-containing protein [Actinokineospora sp. 24-640]
MRRDPPITFRGALKILGHHDRPWLDRLNKLVGGVILGSGGIPPVSALWGWVDQKNEAVGLVRSALDKVSDRLAGTNGLLRQDLVVAAHSTIVLTAYFDAIQAYLDEHHGQAKITEAEKVLLAAGAIPDGGDSLVRALYSGSVPTPSATCDFESNVAVVHGWAIQLTGDLAAPFSGTGVAFADPEGIGRDVRDRYRSHFLSLAATVPEFAIWANMTGQAAIGTALAALTALLTNGPRTDPPDHRSLLDQANQAELDRPVVETASAPPVFPTVRGVFQTPRYRIECVDSQHSIANEDWWSETPIADDLPHTLARHFSSPESTEGPLLLLGHPGAGKSLLMKVLAASLPAADYTVVRVPLRHVDASASIAAQVEQALQRTTNGRVSWTALDGNGDTIRVVLLDGLDELLQATPHDRTAYLRDVVEFQQREATMDQPVAVVVTSRTLVAERVTVPSGTTVVKLEEFDDTQISAWITEWNRVNAGTGARPLSTGIALARPELARQPLLLMMLAVYFADPDAVSPAADMSLTDLYERLFDAFARREVARNPVTDVEHAVAHHVRRLSIAALGMLNRGAQQISEADLSADLAALGDPAPSGKRLLGEFFFIHAAQATTDTVVRTYEFLHATFGEYLVADRVVEVLRDVAESAYGRRNPHEPDDDLLFALLSHETLATQPPALGFIKAKIACLDTVEQDRIIRTLVRLLRTYHRRTSLGRYERYAPTEIDTVRRLASYSANLTLLLTRAKEGGFELWTTRVGEAQFWIDLPRWESTVQLWTAGLSLQNLKAMLLTIHLVNGRRVVAGHSAAEWLDESLRIAQLGNNYALEKTLRMGVAIDRGVYYDKPDRPDWQNACLPWLTGMLAGRSPGLYFPQRPSPRVPADVVQSVAELATRVMVTMFTNWSPEFLDRFLRWLIALPGVTHNPVAFFVVTWRHPEYQRVPGVVELIARAERQLHFMDEADLEVVEYILASLLQ